MVAQRVSSDICDQLAIVNHLQNSKDKKTTRYIRNKLTSQPYNGNL